MAKPFIQRMYKQFQTKRGKNADRRYPHWHRLRIVLPLFILIATLPVIILSTRQNQDIRQHAQERENPSADRSDDARDNASSNNGNDGGNNGGSNNDGNTGGNNDGGSNSNDNKATQDQLELEKSTQRDLNSQFNDLAKKASDGTLTPDESKQFSDLSNRMENLKNDIQKKESSLTSGQGNGNGGNTTSALQDQLELEKSTQRDLNSQFNDLAKKASDGTLTPDESKQFSDLSNRMENLKNDIQKKENSLAGTGSSFTDAIAKAVADTVKTIVDALTKTVTNGNIKAPASQDAPVRRLDSKSTQINIPEPGFHYGPDGKTLVPN